ncbi:hypothetical protein BJ508DRAFT_29436 [Ascobolus immersus RN42]|uniref:Uncharacterized protein n=1 Tax=Ascobolus immersus RN42 TaxID=1160509 RepID=A0A3N4HSR4_ASCIM|nr:hypothetical protein BJ508DRAFT_29436 [Ascobolus immersus RN42]
MFENRDTLLHLLSAPIFAANITSASGSPPTPSQKKEASAFALPQNSRKATQPSPVPSMRETLKEEASSSLPSIAFSRKILMPKSANAQFPRATGNKPMVSIIKFPIDGASKIQCAARKHSLPNNTEPEAKKSAVSTEDFSGRKRLCTQAAGNTLVGIKNEQAIENKVRAPLSVKTKAQRMAKQSAAVYEKECRNADSTAADGLPTPCAHGRTILKPKLAHTQFTTPSSTSQNAEDVTRQIKRKHTGSDEHGRHVKRLAVLHRDATEAFCDVSAKSAAKEGKNELSEKKPIVSHEVSNEVLCDLAGTQRWKHHSTRPLSHHQATSRLARIVSTLIKVNSCSQANILARQSE